MKKLVLLLSLVFLFVGCTEKETPSKKVEAFFASYQTLDTEVIDQLNKTVSEDDSLDTNSKDKYIEIMKKHYSNLKYNIKDELIDGDDATVTVEIEVYDYTNILKNAEKYMNENKEQFNDENGTFSNQLFTNYRLEQMEKVNETITYTLKLSLTRIDKEWIIDDLSSSDFMKIQGIYNN